MSINTDIFDIKKLNVSFDGNNIVNTLKIGSIKMNYFLQKISAAEIKLLNNYEDVNISDFKIFDEQPIGPGSTVKISYNNMPLFEGVVVKQSIEVERSQAFIMIEAKHQAYQLSGNRKNKVFSKKTDSQVISEIVRENNLSDEIEPTKDVHESLVQYNSTDWDFINLRAEANGLYVFTHLENIHAIALETKQSKHTISYENTIYAINLELDGRKQHDSYTVNYWDYSLQEVKENEIKRNASSFNLLDSTQNRTQAGSFNQHLLSYSNANISDVQLKALQNKHTYSFLQGTITTDALFDVLPGDTIELKDIGKLYNGKVLVSGIEHILQDNAWSTILHIGINDTPYKKLYDDIDSPKADNHWAATQGLFTAKVEQIENDPSKEFRILVKLPCFEGNTPSVWARLTHAYAGKQYGCFVIPEVGDEVIVGFINNNPKDVIVIGSVYSSQLAPTQTVEKENNIKGFYSRAQLKIEINEDEKSLLLSTPSENSLLLHDKDEKIVLTDQHGNTFTMHKDGIDIASAKDINIKAPQGDINIQSNNIKTKANANYKVEATAQAEIKTSGTAVLKGSIVQIN